MSLVSKILGRELLERGWTAEQFAKRAHTLPETVRAILADEIVVDEALSVRIGMALGVHSSMWHRLAELDAADRHIERARQLRAEIEAAAKG